MDFSNMRKKAIRLKPFYLLYSVTFSCIWSDELSQQGNWLNSGLGFVTQFSDYNFQALLKY